MPAPLLPAACEIAAPVNSRFSMVALAALIVNRPFCCAGVVPVMSSLGRPLTPRIVRLLVLHAQVSPL